MISFSIGLVSAAILATSGWLSQYHELPTSATIEYRQASGEIPASLADFDGVLAVEDCDLIGYTGWLITTNATSRIVVFDCSGHAEATKWMEENQIVAEAGYYLAVKLGMVGHGGVWAKLFLVGS